MMMKKRILSLLLAVCMAVSMLALPAGAASTDTVTFRDVNDKDTSVAVESMRLLGVVDGYGDGTFRPGTALNRAQFCKMAVYAMNGEGELGRYRTVTVFPDVKPSHWAAAYINMAAKGKGIIAGYADGKFHPDRTVTVGQAVTILMRLLGYKDENLGGIWPESYMAEAAIIGLTDGVSTDGYAALNRGQAARLFLNLLRADMAEGGSYAATLGQTITNTMLISATADGPDGKDNALELSSGEIYQLASGKTSNGSLNGFKGTLILDKQGKVLTFVPDAVGTSRVITLSTAKATQLTDINGNKYTMSSDISTYYNGKETTWGEAYSWLNAGTSITLYLGSSGSVEYVFVGGGSTASSAVIVYSDRSTTGFSSLAGGATGYKIYKNGLEAGGGDMRKYDVATYSSATNTIRVCDTRITGYYESSTPSPKEPSEITVMGHSFKVLSTAMDTLAEFRPGDQITLLLTEDNQVAGAIEASGGGAAGNAMGIVKSISASSATVSLLCGITVTGDLSISQTTAEQLDGQLVRVSSNKNGLALTRLTGGVSGDLDVTAKKLGSKALADNVMIFEKGADGLESTSLSQLGGALIPSNQIAYAATDWAGRVKIIVMGSSSGSVVYYGRAIVRTGDDSKIWVPDEGCEDEEPDPGVNGHYETVNGKTTLEVEYGNGKSVGPFRTGYNVTNGSYVAVTLNNSHTGYASLKTLTRLRDVPNSAWSGEGAVTVSGRTYTVPSDVPCYNRTTGAWMTLSAAHAYTAEADLYVEGSVVRAIQVD